MRPAPPCEMLHDLSVMPLPDGLLARARFDAAAFEPGLFDAFDVPCPDQIARASAKRQSDFFAGRLLARAAMARLGVAATELPIGPDRAPIWPAGVNGAISHARQNCAVLVARDDHLCGVDCEGILSGDALSAVLAQCLSAGERAWIMRQTRHRADVAASLAFSAKESIFKALSPYVQSFFGFECAEVQDWAEPGCLDIRLTKTLHRDFPAGLSLRIHHQVDAAMVLSWLLMPRPDAN